jgi:hypothetical protein
MAEWEFFSEESMYQEIKSEQYSNFGGINTKVSTYITGLNECLDLKNYDFSQPGSYTTRWGSTQFIGTTLTGQILGVYEYTRLDGWSAVVISTNQNTFLSTGTTLGSNFYTVFYGLTASTWGITNYALSLTGSVFTGGTPAPAGFNSNIFDYKTFVNALFFSNGSSGSFFKFTPGLENYGISTAPIPAEQFANFYSLPDGYTLTGFTANLSAGSTLGNGVTGFFNVAVGWLDIYGFRSAPNPINTGFSLAGNSAYIFNVAISISLIPWDYGATALSIYFTNPNGSELFWYDDFPFSFARKDLPQLGPTFSQNFFPPYMINNGSNAATLTLQNFTGQEGIQPAEYPLFFTACPRYLEIYNNQVYMAGFTSYVNTPPDAFGVTTTANYQSRIYWTEVGQPEFIDPDFFDEVRTDDGDRVTGLKAFNNNLLISKSKSFYSLNANSATDITIATISDQYGCLSNRCIITYNQQCLFLDRKGIMRWDGANLTCASDKIEPLFYRMNLDAALDGAVGIHFKKRNECWFGIPVDGSTINNLTIVYNYVTDSWTTFNGFNVSDMTIARGPFTDYTALYGSYSGAIFNFGQSLTSDNGIGITTFLKTTFYREEGNSITKQWRRLYIDSDILAFGATLQVDMIPDHGTSIYATRYILAQPFQTRIDFGIPAKAMQFQFTYCNATLPIRINGLTVEHRFQRSV